MAIVKTGSGPGAHPQTQSSSSIDDKPWQRKCHPDDDADSGADSDCSDDSYITEAWAELCQVGDQTCAIPYELYDLPDLKQVLSVDTWNNCLTEEERYNLSVYLPDMNPEVFRHTLKELLSGENFHFGSPLVEIFDRLKGGMCQPEVTRYREGLKYMQRKEHYHFLRKYQTQMVNNFFEMQKVWENCPELGVEKRLQVWKSWKNSKILSRFQTQTSYKLSDQKLGPSENGITGRPLEKRLKRAKDVCCPPEENVLTTKVDGKGVLKVRIPTKGPPDCNSGKLDYKETQKVQKLAPKGILKIMPKGLLKRHEQPGLKQVQLDVRPMAACSEMRSLETKVRPFSFSPLTGRWEDDNFAGVTPFAKPKISKKNNSPGTQIDDAIWQQGLELVNNKAGLGKAVLGSGRMQQRGKDQEMFNEIDIHLPAMFGGNIGQFDKDDNLPYGKKILKGCKRPAEGFNIFAEDVQRYSQERPMEGLKVMPLKEMKRYPLEVSMCGEDDLFFEGPWAHFDKRNRAAIKHHRSPVESYRLPFPHYHALEENQMMAFQQQPLLFKQQVNREVVPVQMIRDNKELVPKELKKASEEHRKQLLKKCGTT